MKKRDLKKKLTLNRETVAKLEDSALTEAAGGSHYLTCTATVTTGCNFGCLC